VLPSRSPKLNGAVERAQHTPRSSTKLRPSTAFTVEGLNREARAWERIYSFTVRPHLALGYLTPLEFLRGACREAQASQLNRALCARVCRVKGRHWRRVQQAHRAHKRAKSKSVTC